MSTDAIPVTQSPRAQPAKLRIWPAVPLLAFMVGAKVAQVLVAEWTPTLFMILLFGPIACIALVDLWWLVASRAAWSDRFLGIGGTIALGDVDIHRMLTRTLASQTKPR